MNTTFLKSYNGGILTLSNKEIEYVDNPCVACSRYKEVCSKDTSKDKICNQLLESISKTHK